MASERFTKANNPKVSDFDPSKPTRWIQYYGANNLYGWAMSQALPTGSFEWVAPDHAKEALNHPTDAEKGYILKEDLQYQEVLHDAHTAYPVAPLRVKVDVTRRSDY